MILSLPVLRRSLQFAQRHSLLIHASQKRMLTFDVATPDDFETKVLKSKQPVVVDFHASWCRPCKELGPLLTEVIDSFEGKVDLAKVDVDEHQDLAMEYGVVSVPSVLAIKEGEILDQFVGQKSEVELKQFVQKLVES